MSNGRIGILTGGGDCPGLNAVIRATVKSTIFQHGMEVIGFRDGYKGLVENDLIPLDIDKVSGILPRGGTILGTSNIFNPFKCARKNEDGKWITEDRSKEALANIKNLKLDGLVLIGGDGTLTSARDFYKLGVPVVGVPKTIDNDLRSTDVTFGFDSALVTATEALDKLHTTGDSHKRAMILEVMGRYAGWIALRAGIASGGDVILLPEIPYDIEKVAQSIKERIKRGKNFSIIVVSEGAKPLGGSMHVQEIVENSPDPIRLGGISHIVAKQIEETTGLDSRVTILGHLQRGGTPSPFDRWLATRFGVAAVDHIVKKDFGKMVALKGTEIVGVSIEEAVHQLKQVDPEGEEVRIAKAVGTSFGN
jgi:phosphofructokinase-like protein